jgi:mannose-6-phosphate isomerase-like protein (cupin superfamily)
MMKQVLTILAVFLTMNLYAQKFEQLEKYQPTEEFENIQVLKIAEDSLQSSFIIWIKKGVKAHYHAEHTENIVVLEGEAMMTIGDDLFMIKQGDYLNIPMGTVHSVTQILSDEPLKVLSIQSPHFDGSDRFFVEEEH